MGSCYVVISGVFLCMESCFWVSATSFVMYMAATGTKPQINLGGIPVRERSLLK